MTKKRRRKLKKPDYFLSCEYCKYTRTVDRERFYAVSNGEKQDLCEQCRRNLHLSSARVSELPAEEGHAKLGLREKTGRGVKNRRSLESKSLGRCY